MVLMDYFHHFLRTIPGVLVQQKIMIFLLLWLRLLCFFPDNQRMFWQLTLRSVLCGAANSLTSTTKPFHGGVLKIEDNDPLPLTGWAIRMFFLHQSLSLFEYHMASKSIIFRPLDLLVQPFKRIRFW